MKEGVFKKSVSKKKHLFRSTNSWSIQASVLDDLPDDTVIEILDKDEKILYRTTASLFRERCNYFDFEGYGRQGYLPLKYFQTEKATASKLAKPKWV